MYTWIRRILLRTSRALVIGRLELPCNEPTTIKSLWGEPSQHLHLSPDPSARHRRQPSPVPLPAISSHASTNFSIFVARLFAEPTLRPRKVSDVIEPGLLRRNANPIQRFAALTALQYRRFQDWRDGNFVTGTPLGEHKAMRTTTRRSSPASSRARCSSRASGTRSILASRCTGSPGTRGCTTWTGMLLTCARRLGSTISALCRGCCRAGSACRGSLISACVARTGGPPRVLMMSSCCLVRRTSTTGVWVLQMARKTRGLRDTPEPTLSSFFPGSTDMVKFWTRLGFVKKLDDSAVSRASLADGAGKKQCMWVERERQMVNGFK
ncbi:hypothetical protein C8Q79DRAFT_321126 [Trametes meyenii]|nr:hypothetical protein C8Q79DRAFT_321126 [Trametes meyenii]